MNKTRINSEQIVESLWRCMFVDEDGYLISKCNGCPMKDKDMIKLAGHACKSFEDLSVDIPYELAEKVLELLREDEEQ